MPDQTLLQKLADIESIRRTIAQYGQLMDDCRFKEWSQLFAEDGEFWSIPGHHLPGGGEVYKIVGRAAIVESVSQVQRRMMETGGVVHFGGNPIIEVDGETAHAWWDFIVVYSKPSGNEFPFAGRYYADLVRQDGRWRFKRRVSVRPGYRLPDGIARTASS